MINIYIYVYTYDYTLYIRLYIDQVYDKKHTNY